MKINHLSTIRTALTALAFLTIGCTSAASTAANTNDQTADSNTSSVPPRAIANAPDSERPPRYFEGVEGLSEAQEWTSSSHHWPSFYSNVRSDDRSIYLEPMNIDVFGDEYQTASSARYETITHSYVCTNGQTAFVEHFVRAAPAERKPWAKDNFFGETRIADDGRFTTASPDGRIYEGYFEFTDDAPGPYSGANYIHELTAHNLPDYAKPVSYDPTGAIRYGRYQYLSFTDANGLEVEVLIQAGSFDYPKGWDEQIVADDAFLDTFDTSLRNDDTITAASTDPMILVNHERVQARFECGQELVDLMTPIITELDNS